MIYQWKLKMKKFQSSKCEQTTHLLFSEGPSTSGVTHRSVRMASLDILNNLLIISSNYSILLLIK